MPADHNMVIDQETGKSMLRVSQKILIAPSACIISEPTFSNMISFKKDCSSSLRKHKKICHATVTVPKNFYIGDEIAYFNLSIDNS